MFLKRVTTWQAGEVMPVDHAEGRLRERFSREVHNKSTAAVKSWWYQRIFSGRDVPPPERETDAEVVAFVRSHPGAIGYVSSLTAASGVKVVAIRD